MKYDINNNEIEPLIAEEFAKILWPGMFYDGWRDLPSDDVFWQANIYCLKKAEEFLQNIDVYRK